MKIIYEDKQIIVVEKAQNCSVQGDLTRGTPLIELVRDYYEFKLGIPDPYIGLVHRLDRHTGGLVVFAKTPQAARTLSAIFAAHHLTKRYFARVEGPVISNEGLLYDYLLADAKKNCVTVVDKGTPDAKLAKLGYRVREVHMLEVGIITDLDIELFTGRQHQIRVQLSHMGNPIFGDAKYGSKWPDAARFSMALWATELKFDAFGMHYHFHSKPTDNGLWQIQK
ncbi:MAG TPA: RNA pseudouridine synthase [Clostridiales bacterium UBA8960]|jgi:23S rRNA pseudouridine1911/1915/1917 synthase|nr:RNA pseudouridine synthase [Clostridiales bacterium UBA8960]